MQLMICVSESKLFTNSDCDLASHSFEETLVTNAIRDLLSRKPGTMPARHISHSEPWQSPRTLLRLISLLRWISLIAEVDILN